MHLAAQEESHIGHRGLQRTLHISGQSLRKMHLAFQKKASALVLVFAQLLALADCSDVYKYLVENKH